MTVSTSEGALLRSIDEHEIVSLTTALIDAGGENPGDTEEKTAKVLAEHCRALGFDVRTVEVAPGRPNVIVSIGSDERPGVLFVGHSDVVPAGTGWTTDPFSAVVRDGRIFGRGACDMKGGLAAVVAAMTAVHRAGLADEYPMTLACLVDEEDTGLGIRAFVAALPHRKYSCCVVAEPTDLVTIVGCRGAANLEIEVRGRSAHAGQPRNGANAISAAARIIGIIEGSQAELDANPDRDLGPATWNVGTITGGTGTSMVADRCVLTVDRRLVPGESAAGVVGDLRSRIESAGVTGRDIDVRIGIAMEMPGFLTSVSDGLVTTAVQSVLDTGSARSTDIWTASCDGGFVAQQMGIKTVVLGPGEIESQAHRPDESVAVQQLTDSARAYALIATRIAALPAL
ncbi:M20 family metallopeptidase [Rhodococcus sp. IEGM 1401]|uniref:M20 family metallopeptidase n=1 Tax=unclassified Rhodococcus (in: high G+C Gram-positive bacteria) TaxID=192944 RepID=UPI0022B5E0C5|nr:MULTISPECIES: M20 family metallopeptidase [unclassified Rhodococcus (in: high G+C Gram-positive bacteria)]MCZ4559791.1 M20 family metallopeptidase [Rhodococcus sp. IEGM 1401]MDI9920165.1 M20 family metallopeptidase [Rhodococcus sp. IEGM 1372]MDV8032371.1 M20 family metallopeptidase [Rhodococcus sp. IEGM 1414]